MGLISFLIASFKVQSMTSQNKTLGIAIVLFLLLIFFGYHCPIQLITGFPCPGCNMTTSLYYLLHLDVKTSLYFHALLIPTIFVFVYCMFRKKYLKRILIIWCICMIFYYGYRMIVIFPVFPMNYDTNSLFYKIFSTFLL